MKKYIISGIICIASLGFDILTKYLVILNIPEHERINIIGSFVQFTLLYNRGGVFGILQGYQTFFIIVSVIVLLFIVLFFIFEKNKSYTFCFSIALITSGALGNILDRIIGRKGVVDFVYIGSDNVFRWPAWNIADAVIIIGAVLLFIVFFREEKKRRKIIS